MKGRYKMTNQEIFNILSEREEKLFYIYLNNKNEKTKVDHEQAKINLIEFANRTGCKNQQQKDNTIKYIKLRLYNNKVYSLFLLFKSKYI